MAAKLCQQILPISLADDPHFDRRMGDQTSLCCSHFFACWKLGERRQLKGKVCNQRSLRQRGFRGLRLSATLVKDQGREEGRVGADASSAFSETSANFLIGYGAVLKKESTYRERFVVRFSEVGENGTISLETLATLLQEAACNHVLQMDYGVFPGRSEKKLITVTTRMYIEIDRYPVWRDLLEIDTWFQTEGKNAVRRDWTVKDVKTGDVIAVATSKWVLMNVETKRLSKLTDEVRQEIAPYVKEPPRWALTDSSVKASSEKIPKLDSTAQFQKSGLVPTGKDLDMNRHVNNVRYINWMLESVADEVRQRHEVSKVTLEYRREALPGDVLKSLASPEPIDPENGDASETRDVRYIHLLQTANGDNEINRGRTVWRLLKRQE